MTRDPNRCPYCHGTNNHALGFDCRATSPDDVLLATRECLERDVAAWRARAERAEAAQREMATEWVPMSTAQKACADGVEAALNALAKMFRAKGHIGAAEDVEEAGRVVCASGATLSYTVPALPVDEAAEARYVALLNEKLAAPTCATCHRDINHVGGRYGPPCPDCGDKEGT